MTDAGLDPVIHAPVRLRITVTLSTLREGDYLSFSRLQQLLDLTPGNLITHLRKLEEAGYVAIRQARQRRANPHRGLPDPRGPCRARTLHRRAPPAT